MGNFYDGDASELTLDISASGNLGLDTGSEAADKWYYVYAIPSSASTFTLTASLNPPFSIPAAPAAGLNTDTPFKYVGAFYNNASSDIVGFNQISSNEFRFDGELVELSAAGPVSKTTFTLKNLPETAVAVSLHLEITKNDSTGMNEFAVYTLNSNDSCKIRVNHGWGNNSASCDLNINKSNPQTIEYLITNGGINLARMLTKSYIDDLSSY